MKLPRLGWPTGVDSVATPTVHTTEVRSPARITGAASGTCTRTSVCLDVMPSPRAASSSVGSIDRKPVTVFRSSGSMLYRISAAAAGQNPKAESDGKTCRRSRSNPGTIKASNASPGIACTTPAPVSTTQRKTRKRTASRDRGTLSATPTASATRLSPRC
jgi:hypothetical protein